MSKIVNMAASTLIYDEKCPYCVTISKIVDLSSRFRTISYQSKEAQELLEKEFNDPGFTFFLFEEDKIFYGDRAAQRTAEKLYRSKILGKIFYRLYPILSKIFSFLSRRPGIENPKCDGERCIIQQKNGGIIERKKENS